MLRPEYEPAIKSFQSLGYTVVDESDGINFASDLTLRRSSYTARIYRNAFSSLLFLYGGSKKAEIANAPAHFQSRSPLECSPERIQEAERLLDDANAPLIA
jgi:hypothetical protein